MAPSWSDVKTQTCADKPRASVWFSWILLVVLFIFLCSDVGFLFIGEQQYLTTQSFSMAILALHTVGFYMALLGFVYHTQKTGATTSINWAFAALLGHVLVFALRVAMEISCLGYRKEFFRMAK